MCDIEVSTRDKSQWTIVTVTTLKELKESVEGAFGRTIQKFLRLDDFIEIDDDDVLTELSNDCNKIGMNLCLIAVTEDDEKNNKSENSTAEESKESVLYDNQNTNLDYMNTKLFEKKKKEFKQKIEYEYLQKQLFECRIEEFDDVDKDLEKKKVERKNKHLKRIQKTYVETKIKDFKKLELNINKLEGMKANILNLDFHLKDAEKVDICFLVDCTGSMSEYIDETRKTIEQVHINLSKRFKNFELRYSFVGYRDHDDDERVLVLDFINKIRDLLSFMKGIECGGGGDQCEDVFGGLEEVTYLDWKNTSRVLLHIADAPCHGNRFHNNAVDYYPRGDPRGLEIESLLKKLVDLNISYFFVEINKSTYKMIDEFNKELMFARANPIQVIKLVSLDELADIIENSITVTITDFKTQTYNKALSKKVRNYEIVDLPKDWSKSNFKAFKCVHIIGRFKGAITNIKNSQINYNYIDTNVWMAGKPFSKGTLRYAFAGLISVGVIDDDDVVVCSVIKESVFIAPNYNSIEYHRDIVEIQIIAKYLANEFMKIYKCEKKIYIIDVDLLLINETYYTIERYIDGDFKKWSDNSGGINEEIYAATLDAFSHWTYDATNGYLIVTDLQGFTFKDKEYILTDPVIICPSEPDRYTSTNMGEEGIKDFFTTHRCNLICKELNLKKHDYQTLKDRNS